MLGCPHCLDYYCQEPIEACVRRNAYIRRTLESGTRTRRSVPKDSRALRVGATQADTTTLQNTSFGFFGTYGYNSKDMDPRLWRRQHYRFLGYFPHKDRK